MVEFIYPDLYRVDVFEGGELLSKGDIVERINQYLKDKVQVYNQYLDIQLQKAPDYYSLHPEEFDFLADVDPAASPNRTYELYPENYLIDLLGERNIARAAEALYHLNVSWAEERPVAQTVGEYIAEGRRLFDLNHKIEFIMDEYLQYDDPADEFKFDHIAYPTHIEPTFAYELGLIVSDGYDLVQDQELYDEDAIADVSEDLVITPTET